MNHFSNFSVGLTFYGLGLGCGGLLVWVLMEVFPGFFPSLSRQIEMDPISIEARIRAALKVSHGNLTRAAAHLGTTKNVLNGMCMALGISHEIYREARGT